jgi:hypothetical protein
VFRTYDHDGISFAIWSGHGRDPEVAYLDARQLAIATSELGETGLQLHGSGVSYNSLGGACPGDLDVAALHRIARASVADDGKPILSLGARCEDPLGPDGLCETARREPRPGTPADPVGSFALEAVFALQWASWDDLPRDGVLRRAVYMDERFLLEAGLGPDGTVRAWPARGLMPHGLELVTPSASDLGVIEERIARLTSGRRT